MPSLLSRYDHHAAAPHFALPLAFLVTSILAYIGTPVAHSLLTSAVAWAAIALYSTLSLRRKHDRANAVRAKRLGWIAGGLLSLAQICERSVDGRGIWWAHGLLPLVVYLMIHTDVVASNAPESPPASPTKTRPAQDREAAGSRTSLVILTASSVIAIFAAAGSNATIALGLSYSILTSLAYSLIERAYAEAKHARQSGGTVIYSTNGLLSQPARMASDASHSQSATSVLRDVAAAAALATAVAALTFETLTFGGLGYWGALATLLGEQWVVWNGVLAMLYAVCMIGVCVVMDGALLLLIERQGTFFASFVPLCAAVSSQLIVNFSLGRLWFAALCAASTYTFFDEQDTFAGGSGKRMRVNRILTLVAVLSFGAVTVLYLRQPYETYRYYRPSSDSPGGLDFSALPKPLAPLAFTNKRVHPIDQLVRDAEASWLQTVQRQSQTLEAAVIEYKRRYGIPPPPNFDKWYEFAKRKNVQLIDEYDTIYHSLLPFWGLSPATIRGRAKEALGYTQNFLMGLLIRDGKANHVENGQGWLEIAAVGMIEQFVQYLPDMDLPFNTHDEPRVVVPHDDLTRLVRKAMHEAMPAALANRAPRNSFSARPKDLSSGGRVSESKTTRFNVFAHQPVWIPSRLSCSPESPARAIDEAFAADNLTAYALGELGFVYNQTAFTDVCNSPSLSRTHGFFDRPNAFNVVHDLFPVFSQSKMSSFQDIVYPSPWYWDKKVDYVERKDYDWKDKLSALLWRGSTTGGFSRDGGWRRQHRQQMITKLNALDKAKIMRDANTEAEKREGKPEWKVKEVPRQDFEDVMDVHFSHIGQCDPGDCDAQREFFGVADPIDQQDQWKWRYLLDMDGNAYSGRFYAFLKSKSLVFKMAVFREWHEDWIKPWVHYIPLSLRGDEVLEAVRYFSTEEEGKTEAVRLAEAGREWASKALRNEDFEVWLFRLLLEYGRLVDDNRAEIGYAGS